MCGPRRGRALRARSNRSMEKIAMYGGVADGRIVAEGEIARRRGREDRGREDCGVGEIARRRGRDGDTSDGARSHATAAM